MTPWTASDAVALRNFLSQNPRLIIRLHELAPKIKGATVEEAGLTGMKHEGYSEVFDNFTRLSQDQTPTNPGNSAI